MGKTNIASGNDQVAVQVGGVTDRDDSPAPPLENTEPTGATAAAENIRSGNAHVADQVNEVHGGLQIRT